MPSKSAIPEWILTEAEIMSFQHFEEAVLRGGMDQKYYARLCAMARACRQKIENDDAE
jgi:hypothetical protein